MVLGVVLGLVAGLAIGVAWHLVAQRPHRRRRPSGRRPPRPTRRPPSRRRRPQLKAVDGGAAAAETARAVAVSELELLRDVGARGAGRGPRRNGPGWRARSPSCRPQALAKNNEQFLTLADTRFKEARTAAQGDLDQRQQAIAHLLDPLSETLARYERGLQEMEVERQGAYEGLNEKVAQLHLGHEQLRKETRNLVTALRSPQTRGRWGEIQLRRVAEMAGMLAHCDFDEQVSTTTDDGRLRPDMIVHMPGRRRGRGRRQGAARRLLAAPRRRRRRDRERPARPSTPASCAPTSTSWPRRSTGSSSTARRRWWWPSSPATSCWRPPSRPTRRCRSTPWRTASLLTTPITLIALLRTVALGWQQETLAENAREVQKLGAELYDRLRVMTGHMQTLQRSLTSSVEAYNKAVGSLRVARARLGPQVPRSRRRRRRVGRDRRAVTDRGGAPPPAGGRDGRRRRDRRAGDRSSSPCPRADGEHRSLTGDRGTGATGLEAVAAPVPVGPRTAATYSAGVLHVHRSERADALVSMLARAGGRAARRPDDPRGGLGADTRHRAVADPAPVDAPGGTRGAAGRRVRQHRLPVPRDVGRAARLPCAAGTDPKHDPWLPERAVWPLIEVVEEHFDEPWLAPLAQHIRNSGDGARAPERFSSIRHVADLFDRYAVHRPDMLQRWAAGSAAARRGRRGSSSSGASCGSASAEPSPAERLRRRLPPAAGRARAPGPADPALALRADPAAGELPRRPRSRGRTAGTCTSSCCTRRRRCGTGSSG